MKLRLLCFMIFLAQVEVSGLEVSGSGACHFRALGLSRSPFRSFRLSLQRRSPEGNLSALIIRLGFWGQLCYNYNKELPE